MHTGGTTLSLRNLARIRLPRSVGQWANNVQCLLIRYNPMRDPMSRLLISPPVLNQQTTILQGTATDGDRAR